MPAEVDYEWVMELTFVLTIVVGTPAVAILSLFASLPTWPDRALFAVRVGAVVWLATTLFVYGYARLAPPAGSDDR